MSSFRDRVGTQIFTDPIPQWGYFQQVHEWAAKNHFTLEWRFDCSGPPHTPTYVAVPLMNGEELSEYQGMATTKKGARELASKALALSGHC
ncbi:hypothetical protein PUNSTDRAFT_49212, partial [Punctularia strigosozonata HHB-11173 SS5]|uniref:uncharacterized protein n=1 Tax=Punctularia strigosozonata (strain HHB-11173) TaxID=741275 RepID=UPI0004416FB0